MADHINGRTEDVHGNHTGYFFADLPVRDLFAALALAGIIQADDWPRVITHPEKVAADAFKFADAMLAQRNAPAPDSQESEKQDD